ncbi:Hemopexin [Sinosporangium album]|uniref:Hemopexin n=1 Tax=Sinosporangium album TaxID=504805 RepID=A0A1G8FNY7_9ACTN|nr:hemopexin repeat-containing protein [Sinosporangium album]SDH83799.1 Hemopexin [Sinosporangium album]
MPLLAPIATLDLTREEGYEQDYRNFIRAIRIGVTNNGALRYADYGEGAARRIVYRMEENINLAERDAYFSVRMTVGGGSIDLYVRRDNLYNVGFAQVDAQGNARRFYYLGDDRDRQRMQALDWVPAGNLAEIGVGENYQDLERAAHVATDRTEITMSRESLVGRVNNLLETSPSTQDMAGGMLLLTEMVCEAARFYYISQAISTAWSEYRAVDPDTRRQMYELERRWHVIGLHLQARMENLLPVGDGRALPPLRVGSMTFSSVLEVAAALAIIYLKAVSGTSASSGRSARSADAVLAATGDGHIRYPLIDAAVNTLEGSQIAIFFQANETLAYDLAADAFLDGPWPISASWPGLSGTEFANGVSAATVVPDSQDIIWLFRGSQYVRYSAAQDRILVGPKEIYDGWPGLKDTSFVDYIDAAVKDPSGANALYLFRGPEVVHYNLDDDTISGPNLIKSALPGLEDTDFIHGVSAALACPGSPNEMWLFRDDEYLRYNTYECRMGVQPKPIAEGWSGFGNKLFIDRIDAALAHPTSVGEIWFFHDGYYVRFNTPNNVISHVTTPIADGWRGLKQYKDFSRRIDAALNKPGTSQAWLFHGHSYLTYDIENDSVYSGPYLIENGWPGLKSAGFDHVDAAVLVPGESDRAWLFKDDQYLRYNLTSNQVILGPKPIADGWAGLRGTGFDLRIDAAVRFTGPENHLWLFSGNSYVRYDVDNDSIVVGPKAIIDGWNFGFPFGDPPS